MVISRKNFQMPWLFYALIGCIFAAGWIMQEHILFNGDVSWLLEAAKRMLAGGTYAKQIFENNPPWILYFYLPPVIISQFFSIDIVVSFQWYVFLLSAISLILSWNLLQTIIKDNDAMLAKIFLLTLACVFLLLPVYEFGQRDHLFFILIMPYLLLISARLQNNLYQHRYAMLTGFFAGSVLLMKPFFMLTWVTVEAYYGIKKRSFFAFNRPELITVLLMGCLYISLLMIRHMDYLTQVIPFVWRWHGVADYTPLSVIFNHPLISYCSNFFILFYIIIGGAHSYRILTSILLLALIGFLFSYVVQQTLWYYHLIPALSMALLLYIFLFSIRLSKMTSFNKKELTLLIIFCFCLLEWFFENYYYPFFAIFYHPFEFLTATVFAVGLVCFLLMRKYNKPFTFKIAVRMTLFVGLIYVGFYFLTRNILFHMLNVNLAMMSLIFVLGCLFPGSLRQKGICIFYTGCINLIVLPAFTVMMYSLDVGVIKKNHYQKLVQFINQYASHEKIYFFSTDVYNLVPLVSYSNAVSASRFSSFWLLIGLVRQAYLPMNGLQNEDLEADKNFFIDMVSEDIQLNKPKFIFIDVQQQKENLLYFVFKNNEIEKKYINFNYLDYFATNKNFKEAWHSYRYLTTLKEDMTSAEEVKIINYHPFQFAIYERI